MSSFTLEEAPEFDIVIYDEDTELEAVLEKASVQTTKMTNDDGSPVKRVEFVFSLQGEDNQFIDREGKPRQRRVYGSTSTTFSNSPNCRLRAWVTELMAANELPVGFQLDLDDLRDMPVRVILERVTYEDKKAPLDADGNRPTKTINKVKDLRRVATGSAVPAAASSAPSVSSYDEPF